MESASTIQSVPAHILRDKEVKMSLKRKNSLIGLKVFEINSWFFGKVNDRSRQDIKKPQNITKCLQHIMKKPHKVMINSHIRKLWLSIFFSPFCDSWVWSRSPFFSQFYSVEWQLMFWARGNSPLDGRRVFQPISVPTRSLLVLLSGY